MRVNLSSTVALVMAVLTVNTEAKDVYKVTREDGSVVYTDTATKDAQPVNLSGVNSVVVPALNNGQASAVSTPIKPPVPPRKLLISRPAPEENIRDNAGNVNIVVKPIKDVSGQYQLLMAGQIVRKQNSPIFALENLDRGAHTIQIQLVANSGKILASTQQQTFYLHRVSVQSPAR